MSSVAGRIIEVKHNSSVIAIEIDVFFSLRGNWRYQAIYFGFMQSQWSGSDRRRKENDIHRCRESGNSPKSKVNRPAVHNGSLIVKQSGHFCYRFMNCTLALNIHSTSNYGQTKLQTEKRQSRPKAIDQAVIPTHFLIQPCADGD